MKTPQEILRECVDERPHYDSDYMDDFIFDGNVNTIYEAMCRYHSQFIDEQLSKIKWDGTDQKLEKIV